MKASILTIFVLLSFLTYFLPLEAMAALSSETYDDCNWVVTYRGKTYDLAPLTRETLNRPIETDLKPVLEKVPAAAEHLENMNHELHSAKVSTMIASGFILGFIGTRIMKSNTSEAGKDQLDILSIVTGLFFAKATYESWHSSREAKRELVRAVNAFNEESPNKIEPSAAPQIKEIPHAKKIGP